MDLPYLGNIFKYQTKNRERDELLVFIQPTVVNDDVQTLRASLKEERRAKIAPDTYELAHPSDAAGRPLSTPVKRKGSIEGLLSRVVPCGIQRLLQWRIVAVKEPRSCPWGPRSRSESPGNLDNFRWLPELTVRPPG